MEDKHLIEQAIRKVIREQRNESGKTQAKLAEEAGLSEKHLNKIENGKKNTSGASLFQLLLALGSQDPMILRIAEVYREIKSKNTND
ncbi:helix-turn-helix domain-containing protein [Bacillus salitolerans]|uniref:Helix-turn-helix domain-containing protein n=1 Tax=Bacillus salitolerans TaxID=1437434 RepID=A0ABW4LXC2_9BACI